MVDRMGRPEPANAVTGPMEPVIEEILADHEHDDRAGGVERHGEQAVAPGKTDGRRREACREERHDEVLPSQRVGQRGKIGPPVVVSPHHEGEEEGFERRDRDHDRKGEFEHVDKLRHGRAPVRSAYQSGALSGISVSREAFGGSPGFNRGWPNSVNGWPIPESETRLPRPRDGRDDIPSASARYGP